MDYHAPIDDMRFVLHELAGLSQIITMPGFEDFSIDLVDAILQENARFAEQAIAPLNQVGDTQHPRLVDGHVTTSPGFRQAFKEFADGGWQGLNHPAEFGGQGLPKLVAAPASENINAANLAFSLCPLLTDGVIEALTQVGSAQQQSMFIPPMLEGRWTGTMNLTEPQAGSDLAQIRTRAVPQQDGSYRLFGQKIFITFGEHDMAENIVHLVLARTPEAPKGVKGISLFIVPKYLINEQGQADQRNDVWCASIEDKLGIHGSPTAVLLYGSGKGDVGEGAVGYLVGNENDGLKYMFIMMNAARYAVGLQGVALSEIALQHATAYAHERVQGQALTGSEGPVTIAHHPDVKRVVLTMRALTEGSRALAYVAAATNDLSRHHPDENTRQENKALYDYLVPVVKGFCTETAVKVASMGVQVHGGMGYIEETGVAQFYRDARILPIYEGTTAIQANDFLGRKVLRDGGTLVNRQVQQMRETQREVAEGARKGDDADGLRLIATQLEQGINAYEQATAFMLENSGPNLPAAFMGSVPYLMLAGTVHAGWQMARAALVCAVQSQEGRSTDFNTKKLASCVAYASFVLPQAHALAASICAGDTAAAYARSV